MAWIWKIFAALGLIGQRTHEASPVEFTDEELDEFWIYFDEE